MTGRSWAARALVAGPLAVLAGLVCLVGLSLTGWGFETHPVAQLKGDLAALLVACVGGATSGALLGWAARGRRTWSAAGAAIGALPTLIVVTAYFTDRY